MSYADGWAALHLDMPARVPRTEYSAESHWDLVAAVTGDPVTLNSSDATKLDAQSAFTGSQGWDYAFRWSILLSRQAFGSIRTKMGHAVYAAGGGDRDDEQFCPFTTPEEVLAFDPVATWGRPDHAEWVRRFERHYQQQVTTQPDCVAMTGVYVTLVSGLIEIFGWELLLTALGLDPLGFGALTTRYANWVLPYFEALADAEVPVVMVHDDICWSSGPFCSPAWYREYVFPNYRRLLQPLIDSGKRIAYTSDGDFSLFIDDIAACGVHGFVMEPTTNMAAIAERYGRSHFFVGNVDTRVLLGGDRGAIKAEVERCMAIGKSCPGFMLAVGNHIPANTPVDAALYYDEVYRALARR
ncbi:MAG: hypothetical protein PF961_21890 [Planctomycetota bacterium]|jgi:hypothetical protein|nr:hypothetical protein [Planctomycetota bacterium]